jgi:hypothetical protein
LILGIKGMPYTPRNSSQGVATITDEANASIPRFQIRDLPSLSSNGDRIPIEDIIPTLPDRLSEQEVYNALLTNGVELTTERIRWIDNIDLDRELVTATTEGAIVVAEYHDGSSVFLSATERQNSFLDDKIVETHPYYVSSVVEANKPDARVALISGYGMTVVNNSGLALPNSVYNQILAWGNNAHNRGVNLTFNLSFGPQDLLQETIDYTEQEINDLLAGKYNDTFRQNVTNRNMYQVVKHLAEQGHTLYLAAGNTGNLDNVQLFQLIINELPAEVRERIIFVGASDPDGNLALYSSKPADIIAPGTVAITPRGIDPDSISIEGEYAAVIPLSINESSFPLIGRNLAEFRINDEQFDALKDQISKVHNLSLAYAIARDIHNIYGSGVGKIPFEFTDEMKQRLEDLGFSDVDYSNTEEMLQISRDLIKQYSGLNGSNNLVEVEKLFLSELDQLNNEIKKYVLNKEEFIKLFRINDEYYLNSLFNGADYLNLDSFGYSDLGLSVREYTAYLAGNLNGRKILVGKVHGTSVASPNAAARSLVP